ELRLGVVSSEVEAAVEVRGDSGDEAENPDQHEGRAEQRRQKLDRRRVSRQRPFHPAFTGRMLRGEPLRSLGRRPELASMRQKDLDNFRVELAAGPFAQPA